MARVGEEFPLQCPACGGDIRLISFHPSQRRRPAGAGSLRTGGSQAGDGHDANARVEQHPRRSLPPEARRPTGASSCRPKTIATSFNRRPTGCLRLPSTRCEAGVANRLMTGCGEDLRRARKPTLPERAGAWESPRRPARHAPVGDHPGQLRGAPSRVAHVLMHSHAAAFHDPKPSSQRLDFESTDQGRQPCLKVSRRDSLWQAEDRDSCIVRRRIDQ
jgi:hypothetical protein